jgi:hypothetical protein
MALSLAVSARTTNQGLLSVEITTAILSLACVLFLSLLQELKPRQKTEKTTAVKSKANKLFFIVLLF